MIPCQELNQPKTKYFKLWQNFKKWVELYLQNYQQMNKTFSQIYTFLMYNNDITLCVKKKKNNDITPIAYQYLMSAHANMHSFGYLDILYYVYIY
jgi:hypothetical protein